jgi:phosphogluconate dehydratase
MTYTVPLPPRERRGGPLHAEIHRVTTAIQHRSETTRHAYLRSIDAEAANLGPRRSALGCANQAHAIAACSAGAKDGLRQAERAQLAIVSAYNDMLSSHQPLANYPAVIKKAAREVGAFAQVAGGVPAMCDGVTQGYPGMELSLFSREVVALSTAVALAHDVFDGALLLGVCDKIVPGLLIGALSFGHLPAALIPTGPMTSGLPHLEKKRIRELAVVGEASHEMLMGAEMASYHGPGTCTFYGTANSNQVIVEVMGLHLPGCAFVPPSSELRTALTRATTQRVAELTRLGPSFLPIGHLVNERSLVNAVVALVATGGSTNHTLHLVAIAAAAGIDLRWDDIDRISSAVPLLSELYPNGAADINAFHSEGGTSALVGELLDAGLLHEDVPTIAGRGLARYRWAAELDDANQLVWREAQAPTLESSVLRRVASPFRSNGGLRMLSGNLGRAVLKTSAVHEDQLVTRAGARVFDSQGEFNEAFARGDLDGDCVVVVRFQGPKANGMPELHKIIPALSVLIARSHKIALVTDGRLSGASGSVPSAIHVSPEAFGGGPLSLVHDGDPLLVDAVEGRLELLVSQEELAGRFPAAMSLASDTLGRNLFRPLRHLVSSSVDGASIFSGTTSVPDDPEVLA